MKFFYSLLAFLSIAAVDASAQTLSLTDIDTAAFPTLSATMYAFDASGAQVTPAVGDLALSEDGVPRTILSVTCPPPAPPRAISSVLVMDVSGSMAYGPGGTANIELAKAAGHAWVNALSFATSECALTSFDDLNYFNQDFTTDAARLNRAIDALAPQGATDYEMGLRTPAGGGLNVSRRGKHQKVIVFLTDGLPTVQPNVADIIAEANRQNCIIYTVTVNMPCPTSLREIADGSGGGWYENVTSVAEAEAIYEKILREVQSGGPCRITWETDGCAGGRRNVALAWSSATAADSYVTPSWKLWTLQFTPSTLYFRAAAPGIRHDTTITVTARNSGYTVTDITSSNPEFDINPKSFTLAAGESRTVTVSHTPSDSGFVWTAFTIVSDRCPQGYFASGGFPGKPPTVKTLKLEHPNGGEVFLTRSDTVIRWSGVPLNDPVTLEYSIDNGTTWKEITDSAVGGEHPWNVPPTPSTQCLARVTHTPGGDDALILRGHNGSVEFIDWSPDGTKVVTASLDGTATIWDALSGAPLATLDGHGGTFVTRALWSPDGTKILTGGNDQIAKIWNASNGALIHTLSGHTGGVGRLAWNPDGQSVATGSGDGTIKVWDAATGALRHTLTLTAPTLNMKWNKDGTKLAAVSLNGPTDVWNTVDGSRIHRVYDVPIARGYDLDWSPDESVILVASSGIGTDAAGVILVIGTANGQVLTYIPGAHPDHVATVAWHPNGQMFATGDFSGNVTIWRAGTNPDPVIQDITLHAGKGQISTLAWNNDGSLLAIGSEDKTASIWRVGSSTPSTVLIGHTGPVTSLQWSPDGKTIATSGGSGDQTGRIWSASDATQSDVSDARFSIVEPELTAVDVDFGQVPVLSYNDTVVTGFLTNPGTYPLTVDSIRFIGSAAGQFTIVSGVPPIVVPAGGTQAVEFSFRPASVGVKSISALIYSNAGITSATIRGEGIAPQVKVVDEVIDFGRITVGSSKDTILAVTITNRGSAPLNVTGTRHLGPNDVDFTTVARGGAMTLQPGDTAKLDLRFTASAAGRTSGRLLFDHDAPGSPAVVTLLGEGIELAPLPVVINDMIDFGQVAVGFDKDSLRAVTIANIGTAPLNVTGAAHGGPDAADFATLAGDAPFTLLAGDTAKLDFRFSPSAVGPARDTLWFDYEGGSAPLPVVLLGEGIEIPAAATVALPTIEAYAGDTITIPVMLPTQSNLSASTATSFTARMRFNATLLEPISPTPGGTIEGGERVIELELPLTADADGVVARLLFRAALGDDSTTTLILEDPQSVGGPVAMTSEAGTFRLLGICYEGGARLLNPNGTLALKIVEANPTSDHDLSIALETIEAGRTTLRLFDYAGRMVTGFIDEEMEPGIHDRSLDLDGIANGIYILHLQTPSQTRSVIVEIVR